MNYRIPFRLPHAQPLPEQLQPEIAPLPSGLRRVPEAQPITGFFDQLIGREPNRYEPVGGLLGALQRYASEYDAQKPWVNGKPLPLYAQDYDGDGEDDGAMWCRDVEGVLGELCLPTIKKKETEDERIEREKEEERIRQEEEDRKRRLREYEDEQRRLKELEEMLLLDCQQDPDCRFA